MTEAEWPAHNDPWPMLKALRSSATTRQSRLLICAFCRQSWALFEHEGGTRAIELAERLADGSGSRKEIRATRNGALYALVDELDWRDEDAESALDRFSGFHFEDEPAFVRRLAVKLVTVRALAETVSAQHVAQVLRSIAATHAGASDAEDCVLIRDIFGNPFRPAPFSPDWRTDTAVSLARQMYESRDFSAMPILADALQDAGCDRDDILDHCRNPLPSRPLSLAEPGERDEKSPHVRGCWVVDLVLGKE